MEIDRMDKKTCAFGDITPGTVFEYYGLIYMKIHKIEEEANAVQLKNGASALLLEIEKITPLDAKLVIE